MKRERKIIKLKIILTFTIIIMFSIKVRTQVTSQNSISQFGITWEFSESKPVGQFVNGDYYVVGPVIISNTTPIPSNGRNGSVLDLKVTGEMYTTGKVGYDDRILYGRYDASQAETLPINLQPGNSLISTVSFDTLGQVENMLRPGYYNDKVPTRTAAVLTCLDQAVDADAFRPAYADKTNKIYYARNLRLDILPNLPRVQDTPSLSEFESYLQRPWLDTAYGEFTAPPENMPVYGREYARCVSMAALLLCLDFSLQEKETLLIRLVQLGIDLWGLLEEGFLGWPAVGGHGNGRKLPILFAGMILEEQDMQSPYTNHPNVNFSEDIQTMYDNCWTGATVVFAGHSGKDGHPNYSDRGAYEHLLPSQWPGSTGESYRRCCTSIAWVGEAVAARILNIEGIWDHSAFFDYVERWMTEDDSLHVISIRDAGMGDYSASWARQRQAWDHFVEQMWHTYWSTSSQFPDTPTDLKIVK